MSSQTSDRPHDVKSSGVVRAIAIDPRVKNQKSVSMHTHSEEFMRAGLQLRDMNAPKYVLLAHAIELSLKSYLHEQGLQLADLGAQFGHKLDDLFREATVRGLVCSNANAQVIVGRIDDALKRAALRYDFELDLPLVEDVEAVTRAIVAACAPKLP